MPISSLWLRSTLAILLVGAGAAAGGADPAAPELRMEAGTLSARFDGIPLARVVELLATETGAVVTGVDDADATTVAASFGPLPLVEGIRRILEPRSFTVRTSGTGATERVTAIAVLGGPASARVVARGRAQPAGDPDESIPPRSRDAAQLAADVLAAPDSAARIDAIDALTVGVRPRDRDTVLSRALLDDPDAGVRRAAFEGLETSPGMDAELVASFVRAEPDPELRRLALPLLEGYAAHDDGAWAALAWLAESDPDPDVRTIAGDVIARGREASRDG